MRRVHMSTGAWIFAGLVSAAVIAPTAVYAAASSTVAIGATTTSTTANVTASRQLLTTTVAPRAVLRVFGGVSTGCNTVYTPAKGKAIVVSEVTYQLGSGTTGTLTAGTLRDGSDLNIYDLVETSQGYDSQTRTFPIGLPLPSISICADAGDGVAVALTGYLIPASQLPAAAPAAKLPANLRLPAH